MTVSKLQPDCNNEPLDIGTPGSVFDDFKKLDVIRQPLIDKLVALGVPALALGNSDHFADQLGQVRGHCAPDGWLDLDDEGDTHVAILVFDSGGGPFDIVCWHPDTGKIASIYGRAFALGEEQILNPGNNAFGHGLLVRGTPLEWLQARRDGICIIRPEWTAERLRYAQRLVCTDVEYGQELQKRLIDSLPQVFVEIARAAA